MTKETKTEPEPKIHRSWHAITVMNDVFVRMEEWRKRWERDVGMKLSWTKLFSLVLAEDEKRKGKNGR